MSIYTLTCRLETAASLEQTFRVFEDPYNLARITPEWLSFKIVTKDLVMRKGAEIDYSFRWLGVPLTWKTLITEYDPPYRFVDEAVRSPYKLWRHLHTFEQTPTGTVVADRVEYALPLGPLGDVANALAVSRQLRQIFEYRQQVLGALLNEPVTGIQRPTITSGR